MYKALSPLLVQRGISFFELARTVCIMGKQPKVTVVSNHQLFDQFVIHISLSHEGDQAVAMVILESTANRFS